MRSRNFCEQLAPIGAAGIGDGPDDDRLLLVRHREHLGDEGGARFRIVAEHAGDEAGAEAGLLLVVEQAEIRHGVDRLGHARGVSVLAISRASTPSGARASRRRPAAEARETASAQAPRRRASAAEAWGGLRPYRRCAAGTGCGGASRSGAVAIACLGTESFAAAQSPPARSGRRAGNDTPNALRLASAKRAKIRIGHQLPPPGPSLMTLYSNHG